MSNGKIIVIVGGTNQGKTTFIKKRFASQCKKKNILCYARMRTDFSEDKNINVHTNFMNFLNEANRENDTLCIIDEAFTCLPKRLNISMDNQNHPHNKLSDFLVNSRKANRFVIIIYHAFAQIPSEWLIPYLDYIVRFNTNDQMQYQVTRFKSFPNIADNLVSMPVVENYKPEILKLK